MMFLTKKEWKNLARKLRFSPRRRYYVITAIALAVLFVLVYCSITSSYYCFDTGVEWKVTKFVSIALSPNGYILHFPENTQRISALRRKRVVVAEGRKWLGGFLLSSFCLFDFLSFTNYFL